ncbi:cache domain-containing protein [Candidatus Nitrosocosmicus sp. R]
MQNKNIVTKNVFYGIAGLTLLIIAISLATQTPSSAQIPPEMNGNNNNNTTIYENNAYQAHNYVKLLAQDMENRLDKSATILELTGMLPEVKNLTSVNMLDETIGQQKGIPQNADIPKRQVAKDILEKYGEFQVVFFLMPNGDIYIEEPYSLQENLSKSNFAFRDYYKGVITNNDTFLGNVIVSASSGQNQAVMAVPIYSGTNGSLTGIWAGGLDMSEFNKSLQLLNLTNNERIVYVDNLGKVVADSDIQSSNRNESFANLQEFKNAINGKSGTVKEIVDGTEMLVSYYPVKALSNNWAVLLIQPNNGNSVLSSSNYAITNNSIMENDKQKEMLLQNTK